MLFISQEMRFSLSSEHLQPFELQNMPKSKFSARILRSSRHLLPLPYPETPENAEKGDVKRFSNEASINSFVGADPSPASSEFHVSGPSALERGVHRSDSIEELVEPQT